MKENFKKESPLLGLEGSGGGLGFFGGGATAGPSYVDDVFSTFLYTGNGSSRSIDNGIDLSGEGGLTWLKCRTVSDLHYLYDTERGATKSVYSDDTYAEGTRSQTLTSFNSDGFSIGTDGDTNLNGREYVSWSFRKQPGFFDVVTWTGNSVSGRTIAHNLGSVPGMILVKILNDSDNWVVYHRSLGATKYLILNTTAAEGTATNRWNDTEPTSTVFTVGNASGTNTTGKTYVAYLFAHDDQSFGTNINQSIIKCGTYTGNGSSINGPDIDLGFEPQWILIKNITTSNTYTKWHIFDSMRGLTSGFGTANGDDAILYPSNSDAESDSALLSITGTGFKVQQTGHNVGYNGSNYIYVAIRRPNKPPTVATEVFNTSVYASGSTNIGFVPDTNISKYPDGTQDWFWNARITGDSALNSNNILNEDTTLSFAWDQPTNTLSGGSYNGYYSNYAFRRAPGFHDVIAYIGTGSNQSVSHNLEVVPELVIVKVRDTQNSWATFANGVTSPNSNWYNNALYLNSDNGSGGLATAFSSAPTSTTLPFGSNSNVGTNENRYLVYLFATLPGISKIGTYSGTGNDINVDCGFTAGARFVMIKRTDNSGDWYVYDTARGIVSGNDSYLLINSGNAKVTGTDYIDPLNAGFTVTSSAPAALNTSSGTYLFLAIA